MSTQEGGPAGEPPEASDSTASDTTASDSTVSDSATGENAEGSADGSQDEATSSPREYLRGWFTGRLPAGWFTAPPSIDADREEITVVGTLPDPETEAGASEAERAAAAEGRMRRFREETRARRVEIAREAEHRFRRKVSWGVSCGGQSEMFTTLSVPVMTRLRQPERRVLDTLVEGGVARSRSDALGWCVRLVGQHEDSWLAELRSALRRVEEVRSDGPQT
ncbi:MAG TPA: hypothetical protein VG268_04085 [Streptosporangiaceae bacterium]|jgi:hypothetical protein|nr:hypothetical protein [Streptosporangiaceae bacterium]